MIKYNFYKIKERKIMREIKFRSFIEHKDSTGGDNNYSYMNYNIDFHGNINDIFTSSGVKPLNPLHNKITYMQFTGLKDSTRSEECPEGIEIFECDVLYDPIENNFFIVTYDENYANFFMKNTDDSLDKPDYDFAEYDTNVCNSLYVVGNIYENPELIKDKVI
jgi:hypothetical protein